MKLHFTKLDIFVLIIIAFLGFINLATPFGGDQALFITGSQALADGKTLYKDFWDYKPPGIYYFYYIAGSIFGFTEVGIHLFELLLWLSFSIFLIISLTYLNIFENRYIVSLAPLFTAGIYYISSTIFTLTQVEGIINSFLYLTLFLAIQASKVEKRKFILLTFSGLIGGIVLTFKLMFLPIIGMFWLSTFIYTVFIQKQNFVKTIKEFFLPVAAGLAIPLLILFIYYLQTGILELVYKTLIVYPPRLLNEVPLGGYSKLYRLFIWYFDKFQIMIAGGILGIIISLFYKKDLFLTNLIFWLLLGIVVIVLTRISWWRYHTHLLNVPVGILFLVTIDFISSAVKKYKFVNSWIGKLAIILTFFVLFYTEVKACFPKTRYTFKYLKASAEIEKKNVIKGLTDDNNKYPYTYKNIDILNKPNSLPGDIFAASTPLFYYLSGRSQATPLNGWILELFLKEQWPEFIKQLKEKQPAYIFIGDKYPDLVPNLSPETAQFIKENYTVVRSNKSGIWFVNKKQLQNYSAVK